MTNYVYFKKKLTNYLYFMIKIVFNFKCIYMYAWMYVLHALKKLIWLIIYIFIINVLFNFKYFHTFAWSYILVVYKSRDLMRGSMRFCHIAHSMKRIKILLNHIKDNNKFKIGDSLFPLVRCFKTTFCYIFYLMF